MLAQNSGQWSDLEGQVNRINSPLDPQTKTWEKLNEELFTDYMIKPEPQDVVSKWLGSQVYDRLGGSKDSIVYSKT